MIAPNIQHIRGRIAQIGILQADLAAHLRIHETLLNAYLRGRRSMPEGLEEEINSTLDLIERAKQRRTRGGEPGDERGPNGMTAQLTSGKPNGDTERVRWPCAPAPLPSGGRAGRNGPGRAELATMARYGREHYARIGRLGGRPTFHEAVAKAKAREAEVESRRNRARQAAERPTRG